MLFIWTSNGSPLQILICLFMLVIQMNVDNSTLLSILGGVSLAFILLYRSSNGPLSFLQEKKFLLATAGVIGCIVVCFYNTFDFELRLILILSIFLIILKAYEDSIGIFNQQQDEHISSIVKIIQQMPLEEYVSPENYKTDTTSAQLLEMMKIRSIATEGIMEKDELIQLLTKHRNHNETCCICCEEYEIGDPLRVLKRCRHEFHVECIDQWAYTQKQPVPTCPLCKSPLLE